ncbi:hypothetical protein [Streptococcus cristatus]|uniref:hypothetical protein n=1 Tax=Streptococcus cristatus TaxID=45634 RepID=UPI001EF31F94|nr:hypothetical protein [Streptococcus cristatus]MCG7329941.1 hypothetical protein [Streptococcus cristatus]
MKLKDILELGIYSYNPDCKVEIFDMKNFEERLENEGFHEILPPSDENATIQPYGFLIEDAILIAMADEEDDNGS